HQRLGDEEHEEPLDNEVQEPFIALDQDGVEQRPNDERKDQPQAARYDEQDARDRQPPAIGAKQCDDAPHRHLALWLGGALFCSGRLACSAASALSRLHHLAACLSLSNSTLTLRCA